MKITSDISAGLGDALFDKGTQDIEELLDKLPLPTDHWYWWNWRACAKKIIKAKPDFAILGGHSYGCVFAAQVANAVKKEGIKVAYLYAIDPTAGTKQFKLMTLDNNVEKVDEFWASYGFPAIARKFKQGGQMNFVPNYSHKDNYKLFQVGGSHIPSASSSITVSRITSQVKKILEDVQS
jgi:hypothetical protein